MTLPVGEHGPAVRAVCGSDFQFQQRQFFATAGKRLRAADLTSRPHLLRRVERIVGLHLRLILDGIAGSRDFQVLRRLRQLAQRQQIDGTRQGRLDNRHSHVVQQARAARRVLRVVSRMDFQIHDAKELGRTRFAVNENGLSFLMIAFQLDDLTGRADDLGSIHGKPAAKRQAALVELSRLAIPRRPNASDQFLGCKNGISLREVSLLRCPRLSTLPLVRSSA